MKNLKQALLAAALIAGAPLYAQKDAPEIKFDSVPNALQLPAGIYLGEVAGVATREGTGMVMKEPVALCGPGGLQLLKMQHTYMLVTKRH